MGKLAYRHHGLDDSRHLSECKVEIRLLKLEVSFVEILASVDDAVVGRVLEGNILLELDNQESFFYELFSI